MTPGQQNSSQHANIYEERMKKYYALTILNGHWKVNEKKNH